MRKVKKKIVADIQKKSQFKAKLLKNKPGYQQAIKEYNDLGFFSERANRLFEEQRKLEASLPKNKSIDTSPSNPCYKTIQRLIEIDDEIEEMKWERQKKHKEITDEYSIPIPYSIDELKSIEKGETFFLVEPEEIIDIIKPCSCNSKICGHSYFDKKGYLYFKIKPDAPRDEIFFRLGYLLNAHSVKEKRFRKERLKALEVWEVWEKKGLSAKRAFPCIAKELNIKLSTVKTRWYKAYSLIYGKPFNSKETKEILKAEAQDLCTKCQDAKCYKEREGILDWIPCPSYIRSAGKEYLREKVMTEDMFYITHFGKSLSKVDN